MSKPIAIASDAARPVYICKNPVNTALCQALLDKSETYPDVGKDHYRRRAYRRAAETVSVLEHDIPAACKWSAVEATDKVCRHFGDRTGQFILDFGFYYQTDIPDLSEVKCAHKDNQKVYDYLKKQAMLPQIRPIHKAAYEELAVFIANLEVPLTKENLHILLKDYSTAIQALIWLRL